MQPVFFKRNIQEDISPVREVDHHIYSFLSKDNSLVGFSDNYGTIYEYVPSDNKKNKPLGAVVKGIIYNEIYPNQYTEAIASVTEQGKVYNGYPNIYKKPIGYITPKGFIYNEPYPGSGSQPIGQVVPPSNNVGGAALVLLFKKIP